MRRVKELFSGLGSVLLVDDLLEAEPDDDITDVPVDDLGVDDLELEGLAAEEDLVLDRELADVVSDSGSDEKGATTIEKDASGFESCISGL